MNINLHIDRLVLHGLDLDPVSRGELRAAVEAQLRQQIAAPGSSARLIANGNQGAVRSKRMVHAGSEPAALGRQIGTAVASALLRGDGL